MNEYLNRRWVITNELLRILALPFIWFYFLTKGVSWGRKWRILGVPLIQRVSGSRIQLGDKLELRSWVRSNPVAPYHRVLLSTRTSGAEIVIGDDCGITGGSIIAAERIEIGSRTLIGSNCLITDTDFHPLDKEQRQIPLHSGSSRAVSIGSDVFIGTQTIILKGSIIGEGCVIGAGSVVSGELPANVVAAGNPAVIIRRLA